MASQTWGDAAGKQVQKWLYPGPQGLDTAISINLAANRSLLN
jgi:hypothetical protein